jgi:hypothetical protein
VRPRGFSRECGQILAMMRPIIGAIMPSSWHCTAHRREGRNSRRH